MGSDQGWEARLDDVGWTGFWDRGHLAGGVAPPSALSVCRASSGGAEPVVHEVFPRATCLVEAMKAEGEAGRSSVFAAAWGGAHGGR